MLISLIAIGAFLATFFGGSLALRFKDKLHLILGFSAGALIGVAFFDLLPESIELAGSNLEISSITSLVALGFVLYMITDRFIAPHCGTNDHCKNKNHRGKFMAGSLSIHSFLDGVIIGLAFQVSSAVGIIVTIAVLIHDFSDGINTVSFILKEGGDKNEARRWLFIDAIAPVVGIIVSTFLNFSSSTLGIILAIFCGFFLYIGASDLLPESHHEHPTFWTTLMTLFGLVLLYFAVKFAGI